MHAAPTHTVKHKRTRAREHLHRHLSQPSGFWKDVTFRHGARKNVTIAMLHRDIYGTSRGTRFTRTVHRDPLTVQVQHDTVCF